LALVGRDGLDATLRNRITVAAALLPFFAYLATASAHSYWLDGGEFVAAAVDLDIAHPPGHPIAALLGRLFAYLPFGPIPFRVALTQATCAAIATFALVRAFDTTARAMGVSEGRVSLALGVAGAWLFAGAPGLWLQAVRPEVYALQTMLLAIALERVVLLEASWPTHDIKPLYVAALAFGLGLANHHFMGLLVLPAFAPTLARVFRARGSRPLLLSGIAVSVGLSAYIYLPVRAATSPPIDLGHPTNLDRFFWVVSARAYQSTHAIESDPLLVRMIDVIVQLAENLHVVPLILALGGGYAIARTAGARRIGWVWGATFVVGVLGRGWLGFVRGNPDAVGYLGPVLAAGAALTTAFVAAVISQLGSNGPKVSRSVVALASVAVLLGLAQLRYGATHASLARFHATDDFDEVRHRAVPTRAVLALTVPQTVFRHWGVDASDRVRPDVSLFPRPFLTYPGVAEAIARRHPHLTSLTRSTLVEGEMLAPELQSLAARRPVMLEMDVIVDLLLFDTLAPRGALYEVVDGGASARDVADSSAARHEALDRLRRGIGENLEDRETQAQLLWVHYGDALYFAQMGALDAARISTERALSIAPESVELLALRAVLEGLPADAHTPIDVRPFRVGF
jgi:hypothetical protein